mgnify:CR=1 FL=1
MVKKLIKEKKWKGVGNSLKQHKKIMNKHWDNIKKKSEEKFSWKKHKDWLDTFRSPIIYPKGKK